MVSVFLAKLLQNLAIIVRAQGVNRKNKCTCKHQLLHLLIFTPLYLPFIYSPSSSWQHTLHPSFLFHHFLKQNKNGCSDEKQSIFFFVHMGFGCWDAIPEPGDPCRVHHRWGPEELLPSRPTCRNSPFRPWRKPPRRSLFLSLLHTHCTCFFFFC